MRYFKVNLVNYTEENVPVSTGEMYLISERDLAHIPSYLVKEALEVKEYMELYGYEGIGNVEEILEVDLYDYFTEETNMCNVDDFKDWMKEVVPHIFFNQKKTEKKDITPEMVMELNGELVNMGCPFRYRFDAKQFGSPIIEITLPSMSNVSSFIINPTREFFDWLELWFKVRGVEIKCNNTGSILWAKTS